jgi:O-antigen/teichoic acid export membrane protein
MLGLATVGVLGFGARIVSILLFIDFAFSKAWHPHSMSLITEGGAARVVPRVLTLYLAIMFGTASGLALFSPEILSLIAPAQYAQGSLVVGFLAGAFIMTGSYKIIGLGILVSKKTYLDTIAFFLGFLMNLGLTFLLIHTGGIVGAAVAPFLTSIMFFVVEYKIAQRQYFIAYEINKAAMLLVLYTILVLISLWLQTLILAPEILYGIKVTIFVVIITGIGLITFERRHFYRMFSQTKQLLRQRSLG